MAEFKEDLSINPISEWICTLELANYGVFDKAEITLSGKPSFVVITGETGAGKSLLVSALDYALTGSNKRNLLFKSKAKSSTGESYVNLCLADHDKKKVLGIRRSRSASGKRSTCQVNGEKTTGKALSEKVGGIVKFWTAETSCVAESSRASSGGRSGSEQDNSFLSHIDNNLGSDALFLLSTLPATYRRWRGAYLEVMRLERLQSSAADGNDGELIEFYLQELDELQEKARHVFEEAAEIMAEFIEVAFSEGGDGNREPFDECDGEGEGEGEGVEGEGEGEGAGLEDTRGLMQSISELLDPARALNREGDVEPPDTQLELDLHEAWAALLRTEDWLATLADAMEHSFPRDETRMISGSSSSGSSSGSGVPLDIRAVEDAMEDYVDRLIRLQEALRAVGLGGGEAGIDARIEEAHVALYESIKSVKEASSVLARLQNTLPALGPLVERVASLKNNWEALRKKHSQAGSRATLGGRADLQALRRQWREDLRSLSSLDRELPLMREKERSAREAYMLDAGAITEARRTAVQELLSRVNAILPSLEMAGFSLSARICPAISSDGGGQGAEVTPLLSSIRSDGWDDVALLIMQSDSSDAAGVATTHAVARGASSLSSGESARLSLAIESCSLVSRERVQGTHRHAGTLPPSGRGETVVVYDEIDAHVGGEAAVAVARLLKQQGTHRQVIAITHNPVIAAAADQHFVVSRSGDHANHAPGADTAGAGSGSSAYDAHSEGSVVKEVHGEDREGELTRMATGKLETQAGAELARALLTEFNGDSY